MYPTHTLWNLTALLSVDAIAHPDPPKAIVFTAVGLTMTMLPDDLETVKIGRKRIRILGHRGPTHRWWALPLLVLLVGWLVMQWAPLAPYALAITGGVLVGYGMHLWADLWTKSAWIGKKLPRWLRIRTGEFSEFLLAFMPALVLCCLLIYSMLPPSTQAVVRDLPDRVAADSRAH